MRDSLYPYGLPDYPNGDDSVSHDEGVVSVLVYYRYDSTISADVARDVVANELDEHIKNAFPIFTASDDAQVDYDDHEFLLVGQEHGAALAKANRTIRQQAELIAELRSQLQSLHVKSA